MNIPFTMDFTAYDHRVEGWPEYMQGEKIDVVVERLYFFRREH